MEAPPTGSCGDGLEWGDGAGMVALVDDIVRRQGIGDMLAEGPARTAMMLEHPET